MTNKNNLRISLEAITSGTQNFSYCNCIGEGRFWKLYKGEVELADGRCTNVLVKRWDTKYNKGNIQFSNELYILSRYKHENIIGLVGYCNEGNEKIIVYKNASNGILDKHMGDPSLTWMKRLNICIGIAKGLSFLHQGGVDEDNPIKHRDIRCGSILLDGDWNAKICNFEMSSKTNINKVTGYFEDIACNPLANIFQESEHVPENKDRGQPDLYWLGLIFIDMIFEGIKDQIGEIEGTKFDAIAISCLEHYNSKCWLDASNIVVRELEDLLKFKKLHMSLKAINLATQNFRECNCVGEGRFWKSYEGKVEDAANGCTRVVIAKRWDKMFDEADILFLRELNMLSWYKHWNIIRLVGYCDEENEKIIIYEHASNGSLDKHLGDPSLTWKKRLNIGIGVAEAMFFLDHRSINLGGIRSGSILLDGNWNAKISNIDGYVDLEHQNPEDRKLYSLGVILTEMLCGKLTWPVEDYSLKGNIDDMILKGIKEQIDPQSLAMFQATAIKCLDEQDMGDYRTSFKTIARELEMALRSQEDYEALEPKLPINYKTIIPEKFWTDKNKLYKQLFQGILHKDGKVVKHEDVDKFKEAQQVVESNLKANEIKEDKMLRAREVVHNSLKLAIQSRFEGNIEFLRQQVFHIKCKIKSETLHLGDPSLTWKKRLNIGIGVAEAMFFLDHRSINLGGIRSGSILLDGNWNAKISNIDGYVDLEHQNPEDRKLYSLGVILTEMLCGKLTWPVEDYSLKGNIDDMILKGIKEQIDPQSLAMFQATAIKCLDEQDMGDYRTSFKTIARELEMALRSQEDYEALEPKLPINYKTIIPEKFWTDKNKLYKQLFQGILHKDGKVVKHEEVDKFKEAQQVIVSDLKTNEIKEDKMLRAREVVHNSLKLAIQSRSSEDGETEWKNKVSPLENNTTRKQLIFRQIFPIKATWSEKATNFRQLSHKKWNLKFHQFSDKLASKFRQKKL
ncbi:hypothetical protein QVD17_35402 [Tagetes erecta]|uniref:Protein kinase domain-containing protein n=1 Tax=Tagetes erecta TaxID=13708 RepID=A0AAD8NMC8_TARER|nr:hypothetical protein QVD17_35402 [Tagetes erecta]